MNISDGRTTVEQVISGLRLTGWILLTSAFAILLLGSTALLFGKGNPAQPITRFFGACGLIAISTIMFLTVRRWVKWFVGGLVYSAVKAAISLMLGFTPSVPSLARPRLIFLELLVLAVMAAALCARYLTTAPRKIEAAGLVGLVNALSLAMVYDSNLPLLSGVATLGLIQLANSSILAKRP